MPILQGWGRYPVRECEFTAPSASEMREGIYQQGSAVTPRGLGRSYGDSALGDRVVSTRYLSNLIEFDPTTGELTCESGVTLNEILQVFVPKGWFLPVTPGTRYVTVGGAIASDVHGKNHHRLGSFSNHVVRMEVMLGNCQRVTISPAEHSDLFRATAGGMGLTGLILSATIRLMPIRSSLVVEKTVRASSLEQAFDDLEGSGGSHYRVALIDCVTRGKQFGRSLISLAEHADEGPLSISEDHEVSLPVDLPTFVLNRWSIRIFNELYYRRTLRSHRTRIVPFKRYFYPLDAIRDWNRMYGKPGFIQYQFVLPISEGRRGMRVILERITESGRGSFLAVLKLLGKANQNLLSFPMEGYTLALDFKLHSQVFELLEALDRIVICHGGRIYLAKDSRMSQGVFRSSYPRWERFEEVREQYGAIGRFQSDQGSRLGLM